MEWFQIPIFLVRLVFLVGFGYVIMIGGFMLAIASFGVFLIIFAENNRIRHQMADSCYLGDLLSYGSIITAVGLFCFLNLIP